MIGTQLWTRRGLFRVGAGAAAAAVLPCAAHAEPASPAASPTRDDLHGAGFYRFNVGQARVTLISDGTFPMNPAMLLGQSATPADIQAAATDAFLGNTVPGHVNTLLVQTATDTILIDTGCGSGFGPTTGQLAARLALAGVKPDDVTTLILTHLHPDHVGGLVTPVGDFALPNAKVLLDPAERAFWSQPNPDLSRSGMPQDMLPMVVATAAKLLQLTADRLVEARPGQEVVPGISIINAPGHTPGHIAVLVTSGGQSLLYIADLMHLPQLQLAQPGWHVAFDTDPVQGAATRKAMLDRIAADRTLIAGAHVPFPALGHVRTRGSAFEWVPVTWQWPG